VTHICKTKKTGNECSAWVVYVDPEDIPFLSMFNQLHINENNSMYTTPRAGSGVVRMDPLHFLAGCRTRRLNQA